MFRFVSSSSIVLPPLPAQWPGAAVDASVADMAAFLRQSPGCFLQPLTDASYVVVPVKLLRPVVEWTLASIRAQIGRQNAYVAEAWDCEDFRTELCQTFRKVAARAGISRAPLVGGLDVKQVFPWARVPAGGAHAVAAVFTEAGWFVVESQTGDHTPLEAYPNRAHIMRASGF